MSVIRFELRPKFIFWFVLNALKSCFECNLKAALCAFGRENERKGYIYNRKGALCSLVEDILIRRERSSLAHFLLFMYLLVPKQTLNKQTDLNLMLFITLIIFGGPCHLL